MDKVFKSNQTVRFTDTDAAGIVYFANYATYFDESFIRAMREKGIQFSDRSKKFLIPIVESHVNFHNPLQPGQDFTVAMAVLKITDRSFTTHHVIFIKDDHIKPFAQGYISRVAVDKNSFEAISIPSDFRSFLEQYKLEENQWKQYIEKITDSSSLQVSK